MEHIALPVANELKLKDYITLLQCSKNIYNAIKILLNTKKKQSVILFISYSTIFTKVYYCYPNKVKEGPYISFNNITCIFIRCMYNNGILIGLYKEYFNLLWKYSGIISCDLITLMNNYKYHSNKPVIQAIIKNNAIYINRYDKIPVKHTLYNNKVTLFDLNNINTLQYTGDASSTVFTEYSPYNNKVIYHDLDKNIIKYIEDDLKYTCIYKDGIITEPVIFKTCKECSKQRKDYKRKISLLLYDFDYIIDID